MAMGQGYGRYNGRQSVWPKVIKVILSIVSILIVLVFCLLLFLVITAFRPDAESRLETAGRSSLSEARPGQAYSMLTFDIGYGGRDADQDFFAEGGAQSAAQSIEAVEASLVASLGVLSKGYDVVHIQKVDVSSRRSFDIDEKTMLADRMEGYVSVFALDYKALFVPSPLSRPMGRVESGLMTFSRFAIRDAVRRDFVREEQFPQSVFESDPCYLVSRIAVEGGGELVLVNMQLDVCNEDGAAYAAQFAQFLDFLSEEAALGRYVIASVSGNYQLPGCDFRAFGGGPAPPWYLDFPEDMTPAGFYWAVDADIPTRRSLVAPYVQTETFVAVTDGFLLSDNVEALDVTALDLGFEYSARNPVALRFVLTE